MRKIVNLELTIAGIVGIPSIPVVKWVYDNIIEMPLLRNFFQNSRYYMEICAAKIRSEFPDAQLEYEEIPPCKQKLKDVEGIRAIIRYEFTEFPTFRAAYRWIKGDNSLYL